MVRLIIAFLAMAVFAFNLVRFHQVVFKEKNTVLAIYYGTLTLLMFGVAMFMVLLHGQL